MTAFEINKIALKIQSPDFQLQEELRVFLLEQIEKLGKIFNRIESCEVNLRINKSADHENCFVEAKIFVKGNMLFASGKSDSFHVASRIAFADLHGQLSKFKDKVTDKSR